jgi:two-component system C4-dicarboxylate transport response regulator DctD
MAEDKARILLVDDESDTLLYLFDLLTSLGFNVEGSSSALDALGYLSRRAPAVVISDVRMPEMDGLELLERIKRVAPKTRVILLSAFADEVLRKETIEKGGEDLLSKPLREEDLLRALGRVLEGTTQ